MDFVIRINGLDSLVANFLEAPAIAAPILQRALSASQAILAKNTNRETVPWRTGFLVQTFAAMIETGRVRWYPTASYARFVEFGTAPHEIRPRDRKALFWEGADHPVLSVQHPGTKENPFMERIVDASTPEINDTFNDALEKIVQAIAMQ